MTEKRYKGNKYVDCLCGKHANILVGTEWYKYGNIFAWIFSALFALWVLLSVLFLSLNFWYAIIPLFLLCMAIFPIPLNYRTTKAKMIKAGHSEECSRKIARMYTLRASLWSEFKIMEDKDDGKRVWH